MKWVLISKTKPTEARKFHAWKPELAAEGGNQCVYCCISEAMFGGIRNYHVEHFRPKSKFQALENEYGNLFYACAICNVFKGDSWHDIPKDPTDWSSKHFPDPSNIDLGDLLTLNDELHVVSRHDTGRFLIERLHLNRPQLVLARRAQAVKAKLDQASEQLDRISRAIEVQSREDAQILKDVISLMREMVKAVVLLSEARPYVQADTR